MTRHFAAVVLWICLIGSAMPPQDQLRPPVPVQRSENAAQGERYAGTWRGRLLSHNRDSAANGQDTIVLHGDRLVTAITTTLDGTARLPRIPLLLHELRRGDRLRAARALAPAVEPQVGGVSRALNNLVNCYEPVEIPRTVADSLNALLLPPFRISVDPDACTLWRTRFATPDERTPVHSDIPTLILAGEFDARTPADNARRIARTLTRVYVYELPGTGHNGQPPCMQDIIRQFLNDPTRTPDESCIARMPRISFVTRWERQP